MHWNKQSSAQIAWKSEFILFNELSQNNTYYSKKFWKNINKNLKKQKNKHETCFMQKDDNANIFKILLTIAIFQLMYSNAKHQNKIEE